MDLDIKKCMEFTKLKHGDQKRKQGTPYYTHPIAVAKLLGQKGFGIEYQIAGLFHDLLEDTDATREEILALSNEEILNAVILVTKEPGYNMEDYISRIKANDMARMVKLADRIHNLSEANHTKLSFKIKYIIETKRYFISLAKGTIFEEDLKKVLKEVKLIELK